MTPTGCPRVGHIQTAPPLEKLYDFSDHIYVFAVIKSKRFEELMLKSMTDTIYRNLMLNIL